jgi:hypothetical protein
MQVIPSLSVAAVWFGSEDWSLLALASGSVPAASVAFACRSLSGARGRFRRVCRLVSGGPCGWALLVVGRRICQAGVWSGGRWLWLRCGAAWAVCRRAGCRPRCPGCPA